MPAANYVKSSETIEYTPVGDTPAGTVVTMTGAAGTLIGITKADIKANKVGIVHLTGVFEVDKLSTDVVVPGQRLYWDSVNSRVTITAASWKILGNAHAAAGNGESRVLCGLLGKDQ
jgi:predicted RecA/RadA family phage recombinase